MSGVMTAGRLPGRVQWGPIAILIAAMMILAQMGGCSTDMFSGPRFSDGAGTSVAPGSLPLASGEVIGTGPTRVALILPLTAPGVGPIGADMANAARLAMDYVASNPAISNNISLILKDSGGDAATAARQTSQAISEGAKLVLGPLKADAVRSAGATARSAGVPLIGFSNNTGAASRGVYLLNVLPEAEVRRSLGFVKGQGRKAFAAIVPRNDFGRLQEGAFRQAAADLGLTVRGIYSFGNEAEARDAMAQITPFIKSGSIDALFLPDRATAPSFGVLLEEAAIERQALTLIGSADWLDDPQILSTQFLVGAVFPAVDDTGFKTLAVDFKAKYGADPHPLASMAYTAVLLANNSALANATPPFSEAILTQSSGFNGRDGLFRFRPDGTSEYALIMKQVNIGQSTRIDGPKI